ncbi:hypothetical protein [Cohnella cholangitidis]|uniref:hypothetical protein n=1 Tax=Cohnella cholangitidis TaxID=2598458 RepID=UPI0015F809F6|nr:hypothetical protein [Cohnella cholangitidis]
MTERNLDDLENHTYDEQVAELAADMADAPEQSDNLQEIMENEFQTPPHKNPPQQI